VDPQARPYLRALWVGGVLFVAGIVRDLVWHAGHDEFEGTSQQFEAHWLLWVGFEVILVTGVMALVRLNAAERHLGFTVVLAASAVYLPVTVWHFVAHANDVDPGVAHLLLGIGDATIIGGVAWTLVARLRGRSLSERL
jgi:hypothetical protein